MEKLPQVLVIVGPTASGKSSLAIKLARKFGGEIISADSRQVYRGLDIGSGKVTREEMADVPHHLLDVVSPRGSSWFTAAHFKKLAYAEIVNILKRGHLPIICGGTGFYIQAVVDGLILPEVLPNPKLRQELKKLSTQELFSRLQKLDPKRAKNIDAQNPHRLIRAIEIATALGKVPPLRLANSAGQAPYRFIQLGINLPPEVLRRKIHRRLLARMKQGMLAEVADLHRAGVSWKRLEEFGLEYKFLALHLQGKLSKPEMLKQLEQAIWNFSKRQLTWFRRDKRIKWVKNYREASDFWQKVR